MSNFLISLLAALSCSAWVYAKAMRHTGGQAKSALVAAGLLGVLAFIAMLILTLLVERYTAQ